MTIPAAEVIHWLEVLSLGIPEYTTLARDLDISVSTLKRYRRGEVKLPNEWRARFRLSAENSIAELHASTEIYYRLRAKRMRRALRELATERPGTEPRLRAIRLIISTLSDGEQSFKLLESLATDEDVSRRQLYWAASYLGVIRTQEGFGASRKSWWALPPGFDPGKAKYKLLPERKRPLGMDKRAHQNKIERQRRANAEHVGADEDD